MVTIKCFEVRDDIFDNILKDHVNNIKIVDSIEPYCKGYKDKQDIYYDGKEYLICLEYIVNYYCDGIPDCTEWKQCKIRRTENAEKILNKTIDGSRAYELLMDLLKDYYTKEEIEQCLNSHEAEYSEEYKQYHYMYEPEEGIIERLNNCLYYDINGAHNDALIEIFPKAKHALTNLYISRHDNPNYKAIVNYGIGMFCRKGHRKTYNWIVQRTTKSLYKAMDLVKGILIYANTDGFVISAKNSDIVASKDLGEIKVEYSGEVYVYKDKNYWLLQMGKVMKGSCLTSVRKDIDLSKGEVVHYERRRLKLIDGHYVNVAEDIQKENLSIPKKENLWDE